MTATKIDVEGNHGQGNTRDEEEDLRIMEGPRPDKVQQIEFLDLEDSQITADICLTIRNEDVVALKEKLAILKQSDETRLEKVINAIDKKGNLGLAPLHIAAKHSDYEIMQLLVEYGASKKTRTSNSWVPGHFFAEHGRKPRQDGMPFFNILEGTWFHQMRTLEGYSLLHVAAKRGNLFTTGLILEMDNANIDATQYHSKTALHIAAIHNKPEVARLLLHKGATPHSSDSDGNNCLHLACSNNSTEAANAILDEVSDIRGKDFVLKNLVMFENLDDETPLLVALKNNNLKIANRLVKDFGCNFIKNVDENFAIHNAAQTGNIPMVKILLKLGAKCDVLDKTRKSPLMVAAENNMVDIAYLLLNENINVNQTCAGGKTALMAAAEKGSTEMVRLLLDHNANVDLSDEQDMNALHYAALHDNPKMLKLLLDHDIDKSTMDDQDYLGKIPLYIAAGAGNLEAVKCLTSNGSSIIKRDNFQFGPIHIATMEGRTGIVEFLLQMNRNLVNSQAYEMKPLTQAGQQGQVKTLEVLLKFGANDIQDAFEYAILENHQDCAEILLKHGARVNECDTIGETPLIWAARKGMADMVLFLVRHGADIEELKDEHGGNAVTELISDGSNKMEVLEVFHKKNVLKKGIRTCIDKEHRSTGIKVPETPFRMMIRQCPEAAWHVMNHMYTHYNYRVNDPHEVDFEFVDDTFKFSVNLDNKRIYRYTRETQDKPYHANRTVLMENHPLMLMVTHDQKHLLKHPVCTLLLKEKWVKFGRYLYYGMLSFYLLFLALLTTFSMVVPNPSLLANGACHKGNNCLVKSPLQRVAQWIIVTITSLSLLARLVNFVRVRRYYLSWGNLLDVLVHFFGLLFVIDFTEESSVTGLRMDWQWQLGAITITLAWLNLLSLTRNLPLFGIYVIMFIDILRTFSKFGLVFLVFIVAFGTGFHMLLQLQTPFTTIGKSLLKTSVMMIGEFEFESIFYSETDPHNLAYPGITFAFFIGFLIVMSIIIVNLLVGLAVDDIKAVQDQAELKRLAMTVEQVLDVERMLPMVLYKKSMIEPVKLKKGSAHQLALAEFHKEMAEKVLEKDKGKKLEAKVFDNGQELSEMKNILSTLSLKIDTLASNTRSGSQTSTMPTSLKQRSNRNDEADQILEFLSVNSK